MKHSIECLNKDWISSEIVYDGPSLPILEIKLRERWVFLNKSQAEQLVQSLQRQLTEM